MADHWVREGVGVFGQVAVFCKTSPDAPRNPTLVIEAAVMTEIRMSGCSTHEPKVMHGGAGRGRMVQEKRPHHRSN